MSREVRVCAWEKCDVEYTPSTSNQIYHSVECQRLATNARFMKKYYERQARLRGAVRVCKSQNCNTILSRYNDSPLCAACIEKADREASKAFLESLGL